MAFIKKEGNNSLIESFLSLSVLNALNILLPLLTLPYLLRVIGPEKYGSYVFVYAIMQYILMISNYGFGFSATKQISQVREDVKLVSRIFNSVIILKIMLAALAFLLFFIISYFLFDSSDKYLILFFSIGFVIGDIFIPVWLFQGMERMRYLTFVNFISKVFFTIFIFLVIKTADDYIYIMLLNSLGAILAGFFSTIISIKVFKIKLGLPSFTDLYFQLKEGKAIFLSTLSMELYRNSNIFLLSFFVSDAAIGIYAAAEKIIKAIQSVISPLPQALFPHMSYKFSLYSIKENILYLMKVVKKLSIILLSISIITFIVSESISNIILGSEFVASIPLIRIMSCIIFFGGINYILGIVGLINLNKQKIFFYNVLLSGGGSVILLLILVPYIGIYAAAFSMAFSEILLFVMCLFALYRIYKKYS